MKRRIEKPATLAIAPQDQKNEQRRRRVESQDEIEKVPQRRRPIFADRERHRAKGPERSRLHDDADHAEHRMHELIDQASDRRSALAELHQREAEQNRKEQNLKDIAYLEDRGPARLAQSALGTADEGADDTVGDDVQDIVDRLHLPGRVRVAFDLRRLFGGQLLHRKARAGPPRHADQNADDQRQRRNDFEIEERLHADPTDAFGLVDVRDARNHGAEDDRRDRHLDQLDEG